MDVALTETGGSIHIPPTDEPPNTHWQWLAIALARVDFYEKTAAAPSA